MSTEYFPTISKIKFNPNASKEEALVFRHYDENEVVLGKKMKDWLRFSVCAWHTFVWEGSDPFGSVTFSRPWNGMADPLERSKERVRAAFEFFTKLGVPYYAFHDRDLAPEGKNLGETNKNLDEVVDLIESLQKKTGVKLLWGTSNL